MSIFDDGNKQVPLSNFFKFENVGDKVSGILINKQRKEGSGAFPAQMIYTLRQEDGEEVKVGISEKKLGVIEVLDPVEMGTKVGFKFSAQLEPKQPGYKGAKCIDVYVGTKPTLEKVEVNNSGISQAKIDETKASDPVDPNDLPF